MQSLQHQQHEGIPPKIERTAAYLQVYFHWLVSCQDLQSRPATGYPLAFARRADHPLDRAIHARCLPATAVTTFVLVSTT